MGKKDRIQRINYFDVSEGGVSFFWGNVRLGVDGKKALEYSGHAGLEKVVVGRAPSDGVVAANYVMGGDLGAGKKIAVGIGLSDISKDVMQVVSWEVAARIYPATAFALTAVFGEMASNLVVGTAPANPSPMTDFRPLDAHDAPMLSDVDTMRTLHGRGSLLYLRESVDHVPVLACELLNFGRGQSPIVGNIWLSLGCAPLPQ